MRIAIIDIGTNSVMALVADIERGKLVLVEEMVVEPRLGEGLISSGIISEEAMGRTLKAAEVFIARARELSAERIYAISTYVMRAARNARDFANAFFERTQIPIRILTEEEEARCALVGATSGLEGIDKPLVMDVGGGSTETIWGDGTRSIPVGAVSLTEFFGATPPISYDTMDRLLGHLESRFSYVRDAIPSGYTLVGSGGTASTIGAYYLGLAEFNPAAIHGLKIKYKDLRRIFIELSKSDVEEIRRQIPFAPNRADIITAGTAVYIAVMELAQLSDIVISQRGVRYGFAMTKIVTI